jgi:NAD(P)-dependent dehydrogenase (short-subunit alcohol dehydrogenase family)
MQFTDDTRPVAELDEPVNALITGASSGIGLAMLRQLLGNQHVRQIIAVGRTASTSVELGALCAQAGERLQRVDADLTNDRDLARLATMVAGRAEALHLVINAAGILHGADVQPEKAIEQVSRAGLEQVFSLNAFAPILLAKGLMPALCHGRPAVFASLSARVGSIGDNRAGGWYAYRASKAAQNQLMKTFAIELARRNPRACCLMLHPGTVDTPLSKPFQARVPADALFSTDRAASQLLAIIARSTAGDTGRFMAWDGSAVAW